MAVLSMSNKFSNELLGSLLVIPLLGQFLHFYLDSFLWRFTDQHHKEETLKFLKQ